MLVEAFSAARFSKHDRYGDDHHQDNYHYHDFNDNDADEYDDDYDYDDDDDDDGC